MADLTDQIKSLILQLRLGAILRNFYKSRSKSDGKRKNLALHPTWFPPGPSNGSLLLWSWCYLPFSDVNVSLRPSRARFMRLSTLVRLVVIVSRSPNSSRLQSRCLLLSIFYSKQEDIGTSRFTSRICHCCSRSCGQRDQLAKIRWAWRK